MGVPETVTCRRGWLAVRRPQCRRKPSGAACRVISLVGVDQSARGRGAGHALVGAAVDWFRTQRCTTATVVTSAASLTAVRLYQDFGEPSHLARLSWLEGRITRDLDRLDEAEAALKEARDFFVGHEIGLDAARVLLDLATVYDRRGDGAELKRLAAEMVPIFASRDVHPEALAALALFQKAAAAEQVDRALLDRIARELQRTAMPSR